jgi:L-seryl-tRNA(Ser) seleniumtransferase
MNDASGGVRAGRAALPSVDRVLRSSGAETLIELHGRALVVDAVRSTLAAYRGRRQATSVDTVLTDCGERLARMAQPSQRRVFNLTGTVLHTNLGRAPLPEEAVIAAVEAMRAPTTLEYDLDSGRRGERDDHIASWLTRLTGAEAALAVNNCAAATLLAAAALAGGRDLVVSRGQAIEIGGAFRIPDVIAQAGARMVEVGTTNRTRLGDYAAVLGDDTGAILRAHPSNFRTVGFVEAVEIEALCSLGVPVIDDVGSGVLADDLEALADEPPVRRSVRAGAAVVCFSGDKLLGGPQAGLMVGERDAIAACRRHPLARAVRIDKLSLAALEATLRVYRDPAHARRAIPVLAMLDVDPSTLDARARRLADATGGTVVAATARAGGGALPLLELHGPAVALDPGPAGADAFAAALRAGDPPLVGRIQDGRLLLDPRTLTDEEADAAARVVLAARG